MDERTGVLYVRLRMTIGCCQVVAVLVEVDRAAKAVAEAAISLAVEEVEGKEDEAVIRAEVAVVEVEA